MAGEGLSVQLAARVLQVSASGYYEWKTRAPSARSIRYALLTDAIREVHTVSRGTYGFRRVHAELTLGRGLVVAHGTVELLMARAELQGVTGRPRWVRARPDVVAMDPVDRRFARAAPNQLWVTDITEHRTVEGKVYCAVVLDAHSRRVVGWSIDSSPTAALVTNAPAWRSSSVSHRQERSSTPTAGCSSAPGRSPTAPRQAGWCPRWAASATATTTR